MKKTMVIIISNFIINILIYLLFYSSITFNLYMLPKAFNSITLLFLAIAASFSVLNLPNSNNFLLNYIFK
jgi:hypothetical protein